MEPSVENIVQELSKNQYKIEYKDVSKVVDFLNNTEANISNDEKGSSTTFRTIFVATFMLLFNIKRNEESSARKSGEKASTKIEMTCKIFENCKSATVCGAVALFCLPKTLNRNLKIKIVASFLNSFKEDKPEYSVLEVCRDAQLQSKFKNYNIPWTTPDKAFETNINEWMRLSRSILQIANYTDNKNLAHFSKFFDKYSYYKNIMFFLKKNVTNAVIYDPLIAVYLKQCVAPIDIVKTKTKLLLQFKINPHDVITWIIEQLPKHERMPIDMSSMNIKQTLINSNTSSVKPVKSINESQLQHYTPTRMYHVFIGDPNYQSLIAINNISTTQGIKRVQKIMHCIYDVIEVLDLHNNQPKNLMYLTWAQRLELVDSHAKISLIVMTGEELLNYKNNTEKLQALTVSCLNDDNLSTSQTIIIKPNKQSSSASIIGKSKRKNAEQDGLGKMKKPKIEETSL